MGTVSVGGKTVQTDTQPYTPHGTGAMAQSVWGGGSGPPGGGSQTAAAGAAYEEAQEQGIQDLYMAQAMQEADMTPTPDGVYDQALQQAAAAQEAEDKAKTEIIKPKTDFSLTGVLSNMNMGKYAEAAAKGLFGWVKHPKAEQFTNLNDLAIIKALLGGASGESVYKYYKKYKDIINEGLGLDPDDPWGLDEFEKKLEDAPDLGVEGEESQRRLDKVSFYEDQISPQTKGGLEKLAGETIITGENLSPEEKAFNQKVFNARNELDRQWGDQGGQGGGGIPSSGGVTNLLPNLIEDNLLFPPQTGENVYGLPDAYSGFYDSEFYNPNVPSGQVIVPVTLPDGTVVNMPNSAAGSQFQQYLDSLTTTPATTTTPTPFDYSQWPQFGPAGGPVPNYVNQGLGQWPQFNYWNQIANAFPGMS